MSRPRCVWRVGGLAEQVAAAEALRDRAPLGPGEASRAAAQAPGLAVVLRLELAHQGVDPRLLGGQLLPLRLVLALQLLEVGQGVLLGGPDLEQASLLLPLGLEQASLLQALPV